MRTFSSAVVRISVTCGLCDVQVPQPVALRHGVERAEIHHVERAARADPRHLRADDGAEAVLAGAQHAAQQVVADLGRREVEHARDQAAVDQLFHRLAAGAGGVEHEAVILPLQRLG